MIRLLMALTFLGIVLSTPAISAQDNPIIQELVWSRDGKMLAVRGTNFIDVYDTSEAEPRFLWNTLPSKFIGSAIFGPSNRWLAAGMSADKGSFESKVLVWDAHDGRLLHTLAPQRGLVQELILSDDGLYLTGRVNEWKQFFSLYKWSTWTWYETETALLGTHNLSFFPRKTPDGRYLYSDSRYWGIGIKDLYTDTDAAFIHETGSQCIVFAPDMTQVVIGFDDRMESWAIRTEPEFNLYRQSLLQQPGACGPGKIASVTSDRRLRVYDAATLNVLSSYYRSGWQFSNLTFSPDGSRLAFVSMSDPRFHSRGDKVNYQLSIWALEPGSDTYTVDFDFPPTPLPPPTATPRDVETAAPTGSPATLTQYVPEPTLPPG